MGSKPHPHSSEIIVLGWKLGILSRLNFLLHLLHVCSIDLNLTWGKNWSLNEVEVWLVGESSEEPDEWLLKLIVTLGRDIVVLKVLLSVESDLLCLNFSVLNINLVSYKNDWDVFADSDEILVPLWNILVGDSGADVKHDNTTVSSDIVSVSETTEFLLTSSIPYVEENLTFACVEWHWVDFNTESGDVFLFKFTCEMSLNESSFTNTTITNKYEFIFSNWTLSLHDLNFRANWLKLIMCYTYFFKIF